MAAGKVFNKFDVRSAELQNQQDEIWSLGLSPKATKGRNFRYKFTKGKLEK